MPAYDCSRSQSKAPVKLCDWTDPAAKYVTFSDVTGSFLSAVRSKVVGLSTWPKTRKVDGNRRRLGFCYWRKAHRREEQQRRCKKARFHKDPP